MKFFLSLLLTLLPGLCFGQISTSSGILLGSTQTNIVVSNLAAGTNDIWTVPAGKKAVGVLVAVSANTATISVQTAIGTGGSYYKFQAVGPLTNAPATVNTAGGFVLSAGEKFALVSTVNGLNGEITLSIFDAGAPIKTAFDGAVDNTVRTLYTCPANRTAYGGNITSTFGYGQAISLIIGNASGSARTYSVWRVPSGGSASTNNVKIQNLSVNDGAVSSAAFVGFLLPGDFIQIQSSSATGVQYAEATVLEFPVP